MGRGKEANRGSEPGCATNGRRFEKKWQTCARHGDNASNEHPTRNHTPPHTTTHHHTPHHTSPPPSVRLATYRFLPVGKGHVGAKGLAAGRAPTDHTGDREGEGRLARNRRHLALQRRRGKG